MMIPIDHLLESVRQRTFTYHLLPEQPVIMKMDTDCGTYFLKLSKRDVAFLEGYDGNPHCTLTGGREVMKKIIGGKLKLGEAIRLRRVHMDCDYRTFLLLEAIFWLTKRDRHVADP